MLLQEPSNLAAGWQAGSALACVLAAKLLLCLLTNRLNDKSELQVKNTSKVGS